MANLRTPPGLNPRDRRPGERRTLASAGRPGGPIWYVLGALLLLALVQTWFLSSGGHQVSYSDFKQAVRAGRVADVTVGEQTILGTYKNQGGGTKNINTTRTRETHTTQDA